MSNKIYKMSSFIYIFSESGEIFAEIDENGVLATIGEELNQAATILQRIN